MATSLYDSKKCEDNKFRLLLTSIKCNVTVRNSD